MLNQLPNAANYVRGAGHLKNEFEEYIGQKSGRTQSLGGMELDHGRDSQKRIGNTIRGGAPSAVQNRPPVIRGGNKASLDDSMNQSMPGN